MITLNTYRQTAVRHRIRFETCSAHLKTIKQHALATAYDAGITLTQWEQQTHPRECHQRSRHSVTATFHCSHSTATAFMQRLLQRCDNGGLYTLSLETFVAPRHSLSAASLETRMAPHFQHTHKRAAPSMLWSALLPSPLNHHAE